MAYSMYYHFAILLLFRPLIKLRILGSKISPKDVCRQAADAIQGLLKSYSQLYTLQRTPSFVPYFVLTSSIMHLAIGSTEQDSSATSTPEERLEKAAKLDPRVEESLAQGIADLAEMAPCHHFAEQALNILRYLAKKWNIDVDIDQGKTPPQDFDNLVKPYTSSLNFFAPNVAKSDFDCDYSPMDTGREANNGTKARKRSRHDDSSGDKDRGASETVEVAADSMENPLFWPFPMQGRPILPSGRDLEKAGFAVL